MINFSVWNFTKFSSIETLLVTLKDNQIGYQTSGKAYGSLELKNELGIFDDFQEFAVRNVECIDNVKYLAIGANYQVCRRNQETDDYEVKDITEKIIAFEKNNIVKVVILASQSNSERVIKRIFNNQLIWGEVIEDNYVTEDMLYWLFYCLREKPDDAITTEPEMYLNGIISYLGRTNDKINAVRGIGIRVSALLGTLGMLLGEESLRALRPMIQFCDHEINIELFIGNSGKIYPKTYIGSFNTELEDQTHEIKLVLLVCKYILPNIKKGYKDSCDKQEWSIYLKQSFLRAVGNEMSDKISRVMKGIELDIKKYEEVNGVLGQEVDDSDIEELLDDEDIE